MVAIAGQSALMFVMSHLLNFEQILEVQSFFYCVSIVLITVSYVVLKFWRVVPHETHGVYSLSPRLKVPIHIVCAVIVCICLGCIATFGWVFILANTGALVAVFVLSLLLVKCRVLRLRVA